MQKTDCINNKQRPHDSMLWINYPTFELKSLTFANYDKQEFTKFQNIIIKHI